jgi:hypothetical protein
MQSFSDVTRSTLTRLAAYWLILFALAGVLDLALDSSVEMASVKQPLMVAWLTAAAALVVARFLPLRVRVPALLGITVALAGGTVVARELTGLVAPWVQITIVAGMLLVAIGFTAGPRVLLPASVLVVALVLAPQRWDEMVREDSPVQVGVPVMEAMTIVGLGLLAALIRAVLLSSASKADETAMAADERWTAAVREEAASDAVTAQMALLHDTALNTLDAIALGSRQAPAEQRRRCAEDARRLDEATATPSSPTSLAELTHRLDVRARTLGLTLHHEVGPAAPPSSPATPPGSPGLGPTDGVSPTHLPAPVGEAVAGALEEALLNVSKHAGVGSASVHLAIGPDGVTGSVTDQGLGFDPAARGAGFGLSASVAERMRVVGGQSAVSSRPDDGTRVQVQWRRGAVPQAPATDAASDAVARLMLAFVLATMAYTTVVVLAEWQAYERPWITIAGGLLLGAWGLALVTVLRDRRWLPTPLALVTVALACLAPFWTIPADQFCSSSFGGLGWVDARIPLVVLVMLTTRHWWVSLGAALTFVLATLVAGTMWGALFAGCDSWTQTAAIFAAAIFGSCLIAGRTMRRQTRAVVVAHERQRGAEEARVRAESARAEQELWFRPAVTSCRPLLAAIGDERADPTAAHVRRACRVEAGYLRGLMLVARAPIGVREELRRLLQTAHAAGLDIEVRGDLARLPPPPLSLDAPLAAHLPADLTGASSLVITGALDTAGATLMLHLPDLALSTDARHETDAGYEVTLDDYDGLWLEITWPGAEGSRPEASSRRAIATSS